MKKLNDKPNILFLCTGNSCRSQMAEGWAKHFHSENFNFYSAGVETKPLNKNAVKVMAETGVDISAHRSQHIDEFKDLKIDFVISLCDHAQQTCPIFPRESKVLHKGFEDPSNKEAGDLEDYRKTRDLIKEFIMELPNEVSTEERSMSSRFEKYLSLWVFVCIVAGIVLGKVAPELAKYLDSLSINIGGAPVISVPIAICLFFMMYPIMVKIDFTQVLKAGKNSKPILLTLVLNWCIKPFTMYGIAFLFLGIFFKNYIGADAFDYVKIPFGLNLELGDLYGSGKVILKDGEHLLQIPLWKSYFAGCVLLGAAPCTAMVIVWNYLAKGNEGLILVMVALNSLTMLVLYGFIGGLLLNIGNLPIPWEALLLSVAVYVALPLVLGFFSRKLLVAKKGEHWFKEKFLPFLTPITIVALLSTLILLFSFKGEMILDRPQTILWISIPLIIQTLLIFILGYVAARFLKLDYENAAPSTLIGASNHFEVAIATAVILFGLSSGAALATVVGVLIEVPLMLLLVKICVKNKNKFNTGN